MGLFGWGKKKKVRRKRGIPDRIKHLADKELLAAAEEDPAVRAAIILRHHNIEIKPIDEVKDIGKRMKTALFKRAEQRVLADDSEVAIDRTEEIVDQLLSEGQGGRGRYGSGGEYFGGEYLGPPGPGEVIQQYRELESEFGSRTGPLSFLKDSNVITELLKTFRTFFPGKVGNAVGAVSGDGVIVVEVEGRLIEMSTDAYNVFKEQRERLLIAEGKAPVLKTGVEEKVEEKIEEAATDESGIAPVVASKEAGAAEPQLTPLDISEMIIFAEDISKAMDDKPEKFADQLVKEAGEGNEDAQKLVAMLIMVSSYDKLVELVEPYKQREDLVDYIQKLVDNKKWVEGVLKRIKKIASQ